MRIRKDPLKNMSYKQSYSNPQPGANVGPVQGAPLTNYDEGLSRSLNHQTNNHNMVFNGASPYRKYQGP